MKGKNIIINGKKLYYELLNCADPDPGKPLLVFLHEGLGSTAQWKDFPSNLAHSCELPALLYDRYGYGHSEIKTGINLPGYMHDEALIYLPELLDKLGVQQKVILVGHSDGGTIALLFAAAFPERTLAVVSECDHVVCETITGDGVKGVVEAYEKGKLKPMLERYHGVKTDALFYGWTGLWLSDQGSTWSILNELPAVKAPLLAIQGANDHFGSVEQLILKLRHCSGPVQINHLAGCGHVPHHEEPGLVYLLMKEFILNVL